MLKNTRFEKYCDLKNVQCEKSQLEKCASQIA
jgi:hypothetical protein